MWKIITLALAALMAAGEVGAAVKTETVDYTEGSTTLRGTLAYDDSNEGKRPGILVAHDWMGEAEPAREKARALAALGYVGFAVDIYGKGVRPTDRQEAAAAAGIYRNNRPLMRARMQAALDTLRRDPRVDPNRIAAIGYCFGGGAVLELARSGADVRGVVSFHGSLDTPRPAETKGVKAKVLVLHGADDPAAPISQVIDLNKELKDAGVDYQIVLYGHAVHSFTSRKAGNDPSTGSAYNADADRRSWEALRDFLAETLK